jgi:hypothetical protein
MRMLGPVLTLAILACTAPPQPASQGAAPSREATGPKRIVASIMGEPGSIASTRINPSLGSVPGMDVIDELVSEPFVVPLQLIPDREYRANFPGIEIIGGGAGFGATEVRRYTSASTPLPENGYRATRNNSRYTNPEFDALVDRYLTTIPKAERLGWMREIVHYQTDLVTVMGIFYQIRATIAAPRVTNVSPGYDRGTIGWNAREWDVK